MRPLTSLKYFIVPLLVGVFAILSLPIDSLAQNTGKTVLKSNVSSIDFGLIEVNSSANPKRNFTLENTTRNTSNSRDVTVTNVPVNVRLQTNCSSLRVSPTSVDIPAGSSVVIEVTLQNINTPGPLLCSVIAVSSETVVTSNSSGGRSNIQGINSPFLAVEVLANVAAPRLQITDFDVSRTQRSGSRNNNDTVTISQTGSSSSSNSNLTADFGSLDVFEEATLEFEIQNGGNATLTVRVTASNTREVTYRGAIGNNITIQPGDSKTIEATIRSIDGGSINSTLNIAATGSNIGGLNSRISLRITATGNTVDVVPSRTFLTFEARVPVDDDALSASSTTEGKQATGIDLVRAAQSSGQDSETFTLRNEGEGDDSFTAIVEMKIMSTSSRSFGSSRRNSDAFEFEGGDDELEITLPQGDSEQIRVIYDPAETGIDEAQIEVTVKIATTNNSSGRTTRSQTVQEFIINLRGIAIPDNRNVSSSSTDNMKLSVQSAGVQQLSQNDVRFQVEGQGIDALKAQVFNLAGLSIYDSGFIHGNAVLWNTHNSAISVANGVYFYRLIVKGRDGTTEESGIKKFVLMR